MLLFKKVRYKNILSTGNAWTEIDLNKSSSTLIVGENGAGKSTMLDAICFALYGKAFRKINKPQLVNSINQKELMVEVYFTVGKDDYVIKRGIKPNIFEIWRNDTLVNQDASARDYQAYLEDTILKLNYKSFGQVVVLGSSTFVPFMQLPAGQRREIIEDLLDIQIFSTMNTLMKEKITQNKMEIQEIKYEIDLLKQRIESAKEHNAAVRKMKETAVNQLNAKVGELMKFIGDESLKIDNIENEINDLLSSVSDKDKASDKYSEMIRLHAAMDQRKKKLESEISFYADNDTCPTCKQELDDSFIEKRVHKHNHTLEELANGKAKLEDELAKIETRLEEIRAVETEINKHNIKISEHRANIKISRNSLQRLTHELAEAQREVEEIDTSKITDFENDLMTYHNKQNQLFQDREVIAIVGSMLKDGGIKTRIIKQYIPIINKLINKYLAAMDFFVDFQLDENFNETIKSRFRDVFSYASFSEGEKLRIDLSLLFAWRAISKLRNSVSTNLLIMDEIMDSSLDSAGTEEFLKIIQELSNESNIFIISHKGDQLYDKFENIVRFNKVKNFSIMS